MNAARMILDTRQRAPKATASKAFAVALAFLTVCLLAMALLAVNPLERERAHAAGATTVEYRIFEPRMPAGTPLLPVFVPQLPNYPGNLIAGEAEYSLLSWTRDGGLENVCLNRETGEVALATSGRSPSALDTLEIAVFPKGGKGADSPTILVKLYIDLQSEWLVSDGLTFDLVLPGTYDGQPHSGYVGTAQIDALDGITGQSEAGTHSYNGLQDGWVYIYRGVNGTVFDGPTYQLARNDAELANLTRPTAAGDYELTIARPYAIPYKSDPYASFAPGWRTIEFTIAKCPLGARAIDGNHPSATKAYDGKASFDAVAVELTGVPAGETVPPTATASGNIASANVGTYPFTANAITFAGNAGRNYTLAPDAVVGTVTIVKAPAFNLTVPINLTDTAGFAETIIISQVPGFPAETNGGPTYSVESYSTNGLASVSFDPTTTELELTAKGEVGDVSDTIVLKLSDMGNYEGGTIVVEVDYAVEPAFLAAVGDSAMPGLLAAVGPAALFAVVSTALVCMKSRRN